MLVGPKERAVEIIDKPIAVGTEKGHFAGCRQQSRLQFCTVHRFAKSAGEAHRPARFAVAQLSDDVDGCLPVDADKGCIRRTGEGVKTGMTVTIRGIEFQDNLNNDMGLEFHNLSHRYGFQCPNWPYFRDVRIERMAI